MTRVKDIAGLLGWLLLCFAVAAIGAAASVQAAAFYQGLMQPPWAPPPSVFGPVWSVLYALMGLSAWLVWREGGWWARRGVLTLFIAQLVLNASWSWLFFAWHRGALAFVDVVLLWLLVAITLAGFWRVRWPTGALLVPYLCWVGFAAALNFAVWQLNPQTLG